MKRYCLLFAGLISIVVLTACTTNSPAPYDYPEPTPTADVTDAIVPAAPSIPEGFTDFGDGLAIQLFKDAQCNTSYQGCIQVVTVYAYSACPQMAYLEANIIGTSGAVMGFANDSVGSLAQGQTWSAQLKVGNDKIGADKFTVTKANCH